MASSIESFEKENTVQIEAVFKDDEDNVVTPDDAKAYIEIYDVDSGDTKVSQTQMTNVSDTQYEFDWSTTQGTEIGEYIVQAKAEISSDTISNKQIIRIEDVI